MVNEGVCYKEQFYGVQSHRCLQMSPAVPFCNQKCSFCWRDLSQTRIEWEGEYDDPKTIIEGAIKAQNNLLCGFGGNKKADKMILSPVIISASQKPNRDKKTKITRLEKPNFTPGTPKGTIHSNQESTNSAARLRARTVSLGTFFSVGDGINRIASFQYNHHFIG